MRTVPEIARLFALVNVAMADAAISSWDAKFFYQYWRPVTALRAQGFPTYYPLGAPATNTKGPNFNAAVAGLYIGPRNIRPCLVPDPAQIFPGRYKITLVSDEFNGKNKDVNGNIRPLRPAPFKSFTDAEFDNGQSRIYMGIHWNFDASEGIIEGNKVGNFVFRHAFRPVEDEAEE